MTDWLVVWIEHGLVTFSKLSTVPCRSRKVDLMIDFSFLSIIFTSFALDPGFQRGQGGISKAHIRYIVIEQRSLM